jgi:hypothetical protein
VQAIDVRESIERWMDLCFRQKNEDACRLGWVETVVVQYPFDYFRTLDQLYRDQFLSVLRAKLAESI